MMTTIKRAVVASLAASALALGPAVALADEGDPTTADDTTTTAPAGDGTEAAGDNTEAPGTEEGEKPADENQPDETQPGAEKPPAEGETPPADEKSDIVTLDLYNLTDVHGHMQQVVDKKKGVTEACLAAVGCYLDKARIDNPNSSFTLLGDNTGASTFASGMLKDNPTIASLNELKPLASTLGNHELDDGVEVFKHRVDGTDGYTKLAFPYLAMNVEGMGNQADGTPYLGDYKVWTSPSGVKVAFIGAIANDVEAKVDVGMVKGLTFKDPTQMVNDLAKKLKANKEADIVIVMLDDDVKNNYPLMGAGVDGIMGGDTHVPYDFTMVDGAEGNKLSGIASGSYTDNLANLQITYNTKEHKVVESKAILIPAPKVAECGEKESIKKIVDDAVAQSEQEAKKPAGKIGGEFHRGVFTSAEGATDPGSNRGIESSLGDLVADALREGVEKQMHKPMDIGIVNAGGLRADLIPAEDGTVTYKDIFAVLPFGNTIGYKELPGTSIKKMLEEQWKTNLTTQNSRPMLKLGLSKNVSYTYDPAKPLGERITSVTINGQPLDPAKTYTVASLSFMLNGGDNFSAFTDVEKSNTTPKLDRDLLVDYIKDNEGVTPRPIKSSVGITLPKDMVKHGDEVTIPLRGLSFSEGPSISKEVTLTVGDVSGKSEVDNTLVEPNNSNENSIITTDGAGQASVKLTIDATQACAATTEATAALPVTVTTNLGELVSADSGLTVTVDCEKPEPTDPEKPGTDKPAKPTKPGKKLVKTGAEIGGPAALAMALLFAGSAAVWAAKRRSL